MSALTISATSDTPATAPDLVRHLRAAASLAGYSELTDYGVEVFVTVDGDGDRGALYKALSAMFLRFEVLEPEA